MFSVFLTVSRNDMDKKSIRSMPAFIKSYGTLLSFYYGKSEKSRQGNRRKAVGPKDTPEVAGRGNPAASLKV
jgi:hypothetical protein